MGCRSAASSRRRVANDGNPFERCVRNPIKVKPALGASAGIVSPLLSSATSKAATSIGFGVAVAILQRLECFVIEAVSTIILRRNYGPPYSPCHADR